MSALKKRFRAGRAAGVYSLLLLACRDLKAKGFRAAVFCECSYFFRVLPAAGSRQRTPTGMSVLAGGRLLSSAWKPSTN